MANNVGFKMGLQSAVDTLIKNKTGATPGSFYLTSDTHRLYIGADDGSLQSVNEGVETVQDVSNLPPVNAANASVYAGRFYYAINQNILCVFSGVQYGWVQLNPDTAVSKIEFVAVEIDKNQVRINNMLCNKVSGSSSVTYIESDYLDIVGENGLVVEIEDLDVGGIECHRITIKDDIYNLKAEQASNNVDIKLTSQQGNNSDFKFVPSVAEGETDVNVTFKVNNDGDVEVAAKDSKNQRVTVKATQGFDITIEDNHNRKVSGNIDPIIQYGNDGEQVNFIDGVAVLDVYSKSDIAETLKALNAMTYRGTVGTGGSAATKITYNVTSGLTTITNAGVNVDCSIGDTFLVCSDGISVNGGSELTVGSLVIAKGTEGANGFITAASLAFDAVESTADTDTTYQFTSETVSNGGGIALKGSGTAGQTGILHIQGDTQSHITIEKTSSSLGNRGGVQETLTIKHASVERKDDTSTTDITMSNFKLNDITNFGRQITIPVVVGVTTDSTGHITAVKTRNYVVQDTPGKLTGAAYDTDSYTKNGKTVGVITSTMGISNPVTNAQQTVEKHIAFSSSSLQITDDDTSTITSTGTKTASGLQIELVWGTFS